MIDPQKTYTTRSGLPVRIYAVDGAQPFPVHGAFQDSAGMWEPYSWTDMGNAGSPHPVLMATDLIEKKGEGSP